MYDSFENNMEDEPEDDPSTAIFFLLYKELSVNNLNLDLLFMLLIIISHIHMIHTCCTHLPNSIYNKVVAAAVVLARS